MMYYDGIYFVHRNLCFPTDHFFDTTGGVEQAARAGLL
jgi:hypothetical protein